MKVAVLFTGGKDSTYALYLAKQQGHDIVSLITLKSENPDSYMFHTPAIELTKLQAKALGLPILFGRTKGKKEEELLDLEKTISEAKNKFQLEGIVTGALFSGYQKSRIEKIARKLNLKVISPLWHKPQEELMTELLQHPFNFIFTAVAAQGLDKSWLNRVITLEDLERLKKLSHKYQFNLAGEGGEMESLVLDCLLFKDKLVIEESEIKEENQFTARLLVKKAVLRAKD